MVAVTPLVVDPNKYDTRPIGWGVAISLDGGATFTDVTQFTTRNGSITITRAGPAEPAQLSITFWNVGGGMFSWAGGPQPLVPDFARIHVWDPNDIATGNWNRYFNGIIMSQRPTYDGNVIESVTMECVGMDWLLDNPPARSSTTITVGQAPYWQGQHHYAIGDRVIANPDNNHQFQLTGPAGGGVSGTTQPIWQTGSGAHTVDGPNFLEWTEMGNSAVTDQQVWGQLIPIFYPGGQVTSGANLHNLITAVPSFDVTTDMTPRDVAAKMAPFVTNSGYYATYPVWQASHAYKVGDTIEQSPSVHGIIFQCTVAGTSGTSTPAFTTIVDLGSIVADGATVKWLALRFTGRWEASITMTMGQRIEPQTGYVGLANGYYFQVIVAGTSAASPPATWPNTIGATVTTGSVTLRCQGTTFVEPMLQLWTPGDNGPPNHNASWTPDFAWFDGAQALNLSQSGGPYYTDEQYTSTSDVTHYHYSDITLNRDGQSDFANRWYVSGQNQSFAVVNDLSNQQALGIIVSRSYNDTSDTGPSDNNACADLGQKLLAMSGVRETVQITTVDILDPNMLQQLMSCNVTASLFGIGGSNSNYSLTAVSVTLSDAAPKWELQLGSGFLTDRQDPHQGARPSRRYGNDTIPPDLVTWPANWVVGNAVDPNNQNLVTLTVQWQEGSIDTDYFTGYYTINGDAGHWFPVVHYPVTNMAIHGLPRGATIVFRMAAIDHTGNVWRDANGNFLWSVSPSVVTAQLPSAPRPPTIGTVTQFHDAAGYHLLVPVNRQGTDDGTGGGSVKITQGGNTRYVQIPTGNTTWPITIEVDDVVSGLTYGLSAEIIDVYGQHSGYGTVVNYTVTSDAPHVPVINSVGQRHDLPNNYRLAVNVQKFNPADDDSGGAHI